MLDVRLKNTKKRQLPVKTSFVIQLTVKGSLNMGSCSSKPAEEYEIESRDESEPNEPVFTSESNQPSFPKDKEHYVQLPGVPPRNQGIASSIGRNSDISGGRSSDANKTSSGGHGGHRRRTHRPHIIYVALFDYKTRSKGDMRFRKGDKMYLLDGKEGADWRKARLVRSKRTGLVPSVYIAELGSLEAEE